MRPTNSQQVVPTSLISCARNKLLIIVDSKLLIIATCYEQPVLVFLEQFVANLPDLLTGNKQCEHILISASQQPCYNAFADL